MLSAAGQWLFWECAKHNEYYATSPALHYRCLLRKQRLEKCTAEALCTAAASLLPWSAFWGAETPLDTVQCTPRSCIAVLTVA